MKVCPWRIFLFCAFVPIITKAQNSHWQAVSQSQISGIVSALYEDTDAAANTLYVAGGTPNGFCYYDGDTITTMGVGCTGLLREIIKYNDTLYVAGNCPNHYLMKWNGTSWDTSGISANQNVWALYVYNGALYVGGQFTSIGGINARGLAKFDGTSWSSVGNYPLNNTYYEVNAITSYNGYLYIGGQIFDSTGNQTSIARWDGFHWHNVAGGFHGSMADVSCFAIMNNILYIGGLFTVADGNVGNYIAQWDGITLSDVGGGVWGQNYGNGQIHSLKTYHNSVYAGGVFSFAGGVPAKHIAKWDGTKWCGTNDTLNNIVLSIESFHDSLFIGGAFSQIDSDAIVGLAKWIGGNFGDTCGNTTGIENNFLANDFSIFPNPSAGNFTLQMKGLTGNAIDIKVIDVLGQTVLEKKEGPSSNTGSTGMWQENFDLSDVADGIYFIRIGAGDKSLTQKIILRR